MTEEEFAIRQRRRAWIFGAGGVGLAAVVAGLMLVGRSLRDRWGDGGDGVAVGVWAAGWAMVAGAVVICDWRRRMRCPGCGKKVEERYARRRGRCLRCMQKLFEVTWKMPRVEEKRRETVARCKRMVWVLGALAVAGGGFGYWISVEMPTLQQVVGMGRWAFGAVCAAAVGSFAAMAAGALWLERRKWRIERELGLYAADEVREGDLYVKADMTVWRLWVTRDYVCGCDTEGACAWGTSAARQQRAVRLTLAALGLRGKREALEQWKRRDEKRARLVPGSAAMMEFSALNFRWERNGIERCVYRPEERTFWEMGTMEFWLGEGKRWKCEVVSEMDVERVRGMVAGYGGGE